MPLILAIEPDRRQASKIAAIARNFLEAELLVAESTDEAIGTLASRVPDLILTPLFLSPKDESALDDRLRQLDAAGTKVQTLVTPMLASATARKPSQKTGLLTRLRKKGSAAVPDGCEPSVFAAQITEYLDRALAERRAAAEAVRDSQRAAARRPAVAPAADDVDVGQDFAPEPVAVSDTPERADAHKAHGRPVFDDDADPYVKTVSETAPPSATRDTEAIHASSAMVSERFAEILETPARHATAPVAPEAQPIVEPIGAPVAEPVAAPIAPAEPPLTFRQSVLAAFSRRAAEPPPPVPDFGITEAAAVPDFSVVEVEERPIARASALEQALAPVQAEPENSATANGTTVPDASTTEVLHDPALAAEVAAILGSTVDDVLPKETAPVDSQPLMLAANEIGLDADGWEDVDLEAMEAISDAAPSQPAAAARSEIDEHVTFKRPRSGSAAAFVKRIEARLAKTVVRPPAPDVAIPDAAPVDEAIRNGPVEDEPGPSADDYDPQKDLWMPLATGAPTEWPPLAAAISVTPPPAPGSVEAAAPPKRSGGRKKKTGPKPAQDEWGLYDPQQCGFAALLAKLDEVTDTPTE